MKLKQTIINRLNQERMFRLKIADGLGFKELWIDKLIEANKNNGPLTTAKSLQVIRKELGITDSEILEEQTANAEVK